MLNRFRPIIIVSPTKSKCRTIVKNYEQAIQQSDQKETTSKLSQAEKAGGQSQNQTGRGQSLKPVSVDTSHSSGWLVLLERQNRPVRSTSGRARSGEFQDGFDLTGCNRRKPDKEIVHRRTAFEVFEQDTY